MPLEGGVGKKDDVDEATVDSRGEKMSGTSASDGRLIASGRGVAVGSGIASIAVEYVSRLVVEDASGLCGADEAPMTTGGAQPSASRPASIIMVCGPGEFAAEREGEWGVLRVSRQRFLCADRSSLSNLRVGAAPLASNGGVRSSEPKLLPAAGAAGLPAAARAGLDCIEGFDEVEAWLPEPSLPRSSIAGWSGGRCCLP